jgi:hypothetical protein
MQLRVSLSGWPVDVFNLRGIEKSNNRYTMFYMAGKTALQLLIVSLVGRMCLWLSSKGGTKAIKTTNKQKPRQLSYRHSV